MAFVIVVENDYEYSSVEGLYQLDDSVTEEEWTEFYNLHWQMRYEFCHKLALEMFPDVAGLKPDQYSVSSDNKEYWDQVHARPGAVEEFKKLKKMWKVQALVISD